MMEIELLKHGDRGGLRIGVSLDNDEAKAVIEEAVRMALQKLCEPQKQPSKYFDPRDVIGGSDG